MNSQGQECGSCGSVARPWPLLMAPPKPPRRARRFEGLPPCPVTSVVVALGVLMLLSTPAHAINQTYRQQLERSGCTQVSEAQGCDITKTKEQNAAAGSVAAPADKASDATAQTPYAGQWTAQSTTGALVAAIRIDGMENVWVNGKKVKAKRSDGALVFRDGKIMYTIQRDRRLKNEDAWHDFDAQTSGPILAK